jgi:hypothetical protein
MKEYDLKQLLENSNILEGKLKDFLSNKVLLKQRQDKSEMQGHLLKAEHNLRFIQENLKLGFLDWSITGCYYACYHAAIGADNDKRLLVKKPSCNIMRSY